MNGQKEDSNSWIVELDNLSVGYKRGNSDCLVLSKVKAKAGEGEMISVIGSNGVGKSTLLRTITGLKRAFSGDILINSKPINNYGKTELACLISFVAASSGVSEQLTVAELVSLGRFPHTNWIGKLKKNDSDIINYAVKRVGLEKFMDRKLGAMSDGERQRAMIARAIAQNTSIIILDEPTAYLDLPNKYELVNLLREICNREGKTVIYTTHDLHIAIGESDRLWLLNDISLYEGAPEDLMREGRFELLFNESKLQFADESGLYVYPSKIIGEIRLEGEEKLLRLTSKAMHRLKIRITEKHSDPLITVRGDYDNAVWKVKHGDSDWQFDSIYSLSGFLRKELFNDRTS